MTVRPLILAVGIILASTGCSSDNDSLLNVPTNTVGGLGAGITVPTVGGALPPTGLSGGDDCLALVTLYSQALSSAFDPSQQGAANDALGDLSANVPAVISADVATVVVAYRGYLEAVQKFSSDPSNPELQKALASLGTQDISDASDRISAYFDANCPG